MTCWTAAWANDQLLGGAGNDTYVVDSTLDVISSETSTTPPTSTLCSLRSVGLWATTLRTWF